MHVNLSGAVAWLPARAAARTYCFTDVDGESPRPLTIADV